MKAPETSVAWHYTTGEKLPSILASGVLWGATEMLYPHERPVVWFSLHQHYELTARKARLDACGRLVTMSVAETRQHCGGLFRFGVDPRRLIAGESLRRRARIPPSLWRGLHTEGKDQGADPAHWLGHVGDIPTADLAVFVMDDAGAWAPE